VRDGFMEGEEPSEAEEQLDDDEISPQEEGFIRGYEESADKPDEDEESKDEEKKE